MDPETPPHRLADEPNNHPLRAITRRMVAIYKDQFGRGPRHAHCHYAGPNAIACFLEQTFTPSERKLVELGAQQQLRETRLLFQYADEELFRSAVEEVTGRRVVAFFSAIDATADMAVELFVLEPPSSAPAREPLEIHLAGMPEPDEPSEGEDAPRGPVAEPPAPL